MQIIEIAASGFFELLKLRGSSMWEIFAGMIDGKEKEIVFLDDEKKVLFSYTLPATLEKLNLDKEKFAKEYSEKLSGLN